jgi:hypothetical protein
MTKPYYEPIILDGKPVEKITAFLFHKGGNDDPKKLKANENKSFQGSIVLGMGFTFDDSNETATPISEMHRLITENPKNSEVIFPYIGGSEVNSSPTHQHHRSSREHLTCAMSINAYSSQKLENLEPDHKEK